MPVANTSPSWKVMLRNANAHAVRLAFELGCDVAKTTWTGNKDSFMKISSAAPIPVLVAGGPATGDSKAILTMVRNALDAGACGSVHGTSSVFTSKRRSNCQSIGNARTSRFYGGRSDELL